MNPVQKGELEASKSLFFEEIEHDLQSNVQRIHYSIEIKLNWSLNY